MSIQHQKQAFDIPEDITFLNTASQSPSFEAVNTAGLEGLMEKRRPYLVSGAAYFEPAILLKKLYAQLIKVNDYNRIALIPSASYGIATVANNIVLKPTDHILVLDEQFPSNYHSWKKLADQYNATIKVVKTPKHTTNIGKQWNQNIIDAINDDTALIAIGNIHWFNGTLFDLKAIRQKTNTHNALLIIDGSQSVGALPFSVKDINPDALICAGYKWLFGPYGCGYGYFGPYFDNGNPIEENWVNRLNSENYATLTDYEDKYKPLANRYSSGESASFINVKMQIAALKQLNKWTPEAIQTYCKSITLNAVSNLKQLGCSIEEENDRAHHLFGITIPKHTNIDILKADLAKQNIFVSFRGHCIRVSCHVFNTSEDFDKLTHCISNAINNN